MSACEFRDDVGLSRLRAELASGAWERQHQDGLEKQELDLGYRLTISDH